MLSGKATAEKGRVIVASSHGPAINKETGRPVDSFGAVAVAESSGSRGLGDTIAKITGAVGIKTCGKCEERRKKLNKIFPYRGDK